MTWLHWLPVLQAEESVSSAEVGIISSGNLKKDDSHAIVSKWRRVASGGLADEKVKRKRQITLDKMMADGILLTGTAAHKFV